MNSHIKLKLLSILFGVFGYFFSITANAGPIYVDVLALENSTVGGSGLNTGVNVSSGDDLWITAESDDCWSAGGELDLLRTSNANGLVTGSTNPCTNVAWTAGQLNLGGFVANYGSLVGKIGGSDFFLIGTSYNEISTLSGLLTLYYFDDNSGDNFGSVNVKIEIHDDNGNVQVPEPATLAILGLGLAGLGFYRRKKA